MADTLLMTKVRLPILRNILVPREKVLRQLSEGVQDGHLLTLVSAPAGYGNTTTICMWVEEAGHPVAGVTLEKSDNDLKQFLTYFLTALQQAGDNLGQSALEVVQNTREINLQRILGLLIDDLYDLNQPIVLVLDDYHLLTEAAILEAMEFSPHHQPRQFQCSASSIPKMAVLERLTCHLANPTENTNAYHN